MSNYILLGVKSGNLSFIFGRPIICKTLKHIGTTGQDVYSVLLPKDLVGSSPIG